MKSIICISLAALLTIMLGFSSQNINSGPSEKRAKIVLLLDNYVCSEDQWIYLYGFKEWLSGNERVIFDSVFIEKGQCKAELQANIPIDRKSTRLNSSHIEESRMPSSA